MICMRCKSSMRRVVVKGVVLDRCDRCRSFWVDGGELETLRRNKGGRRADAVAQVLAERRAESADPLVCETMCPRCQESVTPTRLGNMTVEQCVECQGLFFDYGELETCLFGASGKKDWFNAFLGLLGIRV